jgi:hypothetical protein
MAVARTSEESELSEVVCINDLLSKQKYENHDQENETKAAASPCEMRVSGVIAAAQAAEQNEQNDNKQDRAERHGVALCFGLWFGELRVSLPWNPTAFREQERAWWANPALQLHPPRILRERGARVAFGRPVAMLA